MKFRVLFSLFALYGTLSLLLVMVNSSAVNASPLRYQEEIDAFYLSREGSPYWFSRSRLSQSGKDVFEILEKSWENGLNPKSYHVDQIQAIFDANRRLDEDQRLMVEILLTDGYIGYVRDLSGMRVNARDIGLKSKHWRQAIGAEDALSYLSAGHDVKSVLHAQEPQGATYKNLKNELIDLVKKINDEDDLYIHPKLSFGTLVRPGRKYIDIPKLRSRLGLGEVEEGLGNVYDPDLVNAVMDFQSSNGLKADGLIGKQTLYVLNQTPYDKIKQVIVNMERLRWVSDEKPDRFIVVNIPSAILWAVENGDVRFEMPVVVGRKKRQTNSFVTQIHGVRFNPTWTVPPTIKEEDILPELVKDPGYLAGKGMELYDGYDKDAPTLDPTVIDWSSVSENDLKMLRMVQVPGKSNPLGLIRILMPNEHNIYLHDTNHKSLFLRSNRAKSSGCVRLSSPKKVAEFVLEKRKGWSTRKMNKILDEEKIRDIYTSERMSVYILYYTVWLGSDGQVVYGNDLYDRDKKLLQLLEKLDGLPVMGEYEEGVMSIVQK